jgi:putative DNA primase/helicase
MTAQEFITRLDGVRKNGSGWQARCPAHVDRNPSLSISEREGRILVNCHAGCEPLSIVSAMGLAMRDLFADATPAAKGGDAQIAATYDYRDETGEVLFQAVRYIPKDFKFRRPDGKGGWYGNLKGTRRVLFNLPAVMKADDVLICEGEKDCNNALRLQLVATCNPGGAGKWKPEYAEFLRDKRVAVICDADAPGQDHGREVARSLVGLATSVRLIEALPPGSGVKDLSDFVALFDDAATAREALLTWIQDIPELTPAAVAGWQPSKPATGFTLTLLSDLLSKPDVPVDYLWEGLLPMGTVSGVFAKPKVGKGTLARNLCLTVSRGEDFLGRKTKQGECIYLALEERETDIKRDFRAMGADGSEPILIHAAAAPAEGIRTLCDLVRERKPALCVIDPIFRLATRIRDEKAYAETYAALGPLIDAARETGTHIMLLHHSGKSLKADPTDSPLGSTAIAGVVATLIVLKRTDSYRTIQTVQRIGDAMPETVLQFDSETRRLSTGGTRFEAERRQCEESILEFLKAASEPQTQAQIRDAVEGKTQTIRAALTAVVAAGTVQKSGDGTRGKPFVYGFWFSGSQYIAGTREPETEIGGASRINTERMLVPEKSEKSFLVPKIERAKKAKVRRTSDLLFH